MTDSADSSLAGMKTFYAGGFGATSRFQKILFTDGKDSPEVEYLLVPASSKPNSLAIQSKQRRLQQDAIPRGNSANGTGFERRRGVFRIWPGHAGM